MPRYWISFDLGLQGNYEPLYGWLDRQEAKECGDNVATFVSDQSRDRIAHDLADILSTAGNPRVYLVSMNKGGKFILGKRKFAPWKGYAEVEVESGEER
jgi:hypothetical protein